MSNTWPPPPDLDSLKELFATADVEGLIADGCPTDEYDPEAKHFHETTLGWASQNFTPDRTVPVLAEIFAGQFNEERAERSTALTQLAAEIERFFGPEAKPQVRTTS